VYFFDERGNYITFFEGDEADKNHVIFSPGGEYMVLDRGTYADRFYRIFNFETEEPVEEFYGMGLTWLDPERFAFTYIDEDKGNRSENADITGWFSVAVYDAENDEFETLIDATANEDYHLIDVDFDAGELIIQKFSVKNAREEIRVPIP